jgi:hypothetical protein
MTRNGLLVTGCLLALLAPAAGAAGPPAATSETDAMVAAAFAAADPFFAAAADPFFAPDEPDSPDAVTFSYFHVLGASMRPRDTTATVTYDGLGCAHMTGGDGFATFPVTIPDGSLLRFVRLYFCDTDVAGDVAAYLYEFDPPGGAFTELLLLPSGSSAGCSTVLSADLNYTVSNTRALALLVGSSDANEQYCGLRVAYYLPYIFRDGFGTGDFGRWSSVVN